MYKTNEINIVISQKIIGMVHWHALKYVEDF